jgi:hypothetical protein
MFSTLMVRVQTIARQAAKNQIGPAPVGGRAAS